jgi:hypothetical protein
MAVMAPAAAHAGFPMGRAGLEPATYNEAKRRGSGQGRSGEATERAGGDPPIPKGEAVVQTSVGSAISPLLARAANSTADYPNRSE